MTTKRNHLCPFERKRLEEQERIDNLSREKTLTVKAYFTREDYETEYEGEDLEPKHEELCKISEWEWETSKMSLPILADNYLYYQIYEIVDESGKVYKFIEG